MGFIAWLGYQFFEAKAAAEEFISTVREHNIEGEKRWFDVHKPLEQPPPGLLDDMAESKGALSTEQTGFSGVWPWVPFSCFSGELSGTDRFWIVMSKRPGGWKVSTLSKNKQPEICAYDH